MGVCAMCGNDYDKAFTVTTFDREENKGNGDLWLVPADGSAPPGRDVHCLEQLGRVG